VKSSSTDFATTVWANAFLSVQRPAPAVTTSTGADMVPLAIDLAREHNGHQFSAEGVCGLSSRKRFRSNHPQASCPSLPFRLTSGIISVCLDLAGLFRNKDIHQC
jgi:hypothetical protein